ncbi:MAG: hypothetical protein ACFFCW_26095 [Candidatus Hodarchaeota archaeon]
MPKRSTITKRQRKAIRTYVKQGISANKIQKKLSKQGLGIRRKTLLSEVRKLKRQKPRADRKKYTPHKYRVRKLKKRFPMMQQIAVYSTVHGRSRRVQIAGTRKQLYRAMQYVYKYPPKQRFLTIGAVELLNDPWRYLDRKERWDRHPDIKS